MSFPFLQQPEVPFKIQNPVTSFLLLFETLPGDSEQIQRSCLQGLHLPSRSTLFSSWPFLRHSPQVSCSFWCPRNFCTVGSPRLLDACLPPCFMRPPAPTVTPNQRPFSISHFYLLPLTRQTLYIYQFSLCVHRCNFLVRRILTPLAPRAVPAWHVQSFILFVE